MGKNAEAEGIAVAVVSPIHGGDNLPVVIGIPVVTAFASVAPVAPPAYFKGSGMSPMAWGILAAADEFTIRQQIKMFPEYCFGCPPCLAQPNSYMISVGMDKSGTDMSGIAFRADEVSDKWNRCCCHPNQPFKMEFRQYIPMPGEHNGTASEAARLMQEFSDSANDMSISAKSHNLREHYAKQPVAFTAIRDGTQCVPINGCFPGMCLGHLACFDCCLDGVTVVAGGTSEETSVDIGKVDSAQQGIIGSSKVPCLGGHCHPTLHLREGTNDAPWAKLEGPMCFGGCSELCCDFSFPVSRFDSDSHAGDIAELTKRAPRGIAAAAKEMFSDADVFTVSFKDKNLTPEQKALILGNQLLVDYMFFERGEQDKCGSLDDGSGFFINCCNCYFYGIVCPCKINIKTGSGSGDD